MNAPAPSTLSSQHFEFVKLAGLCRSPTNPRRSFPADKMAEMADSVGKHGILQPVLLRAWPFGQATPDGDSTLVHPIPAYEIVAGERRCRAALLAGIEDIPAIIRELSDNEVLEIQIIENLQREEVHPLEEAEGFQLLMERTGFSAEEIADKVGRSKAYVYARLKLCALGQAGREAFRAGQLNASTALLIARIPGDKLQAQALEAIINQWSGPLSFRSAAQVIQNRFTLRLREAPFNLDQVNLVAGVGSCAACPSRSGNQPELFADIESADVCTDPGCFQRKREAWAALKRADAVAAGYEVITGDKAEQIVPSWAANIDHLKNGFVALDARCDDAKPVREIPPEPDEPETDEDDESPEWKAYYEACDAWEEQREAAWPTYRELLAGESIVVVFVQHPQTGDMIECVKESDIMPILEAKGVFESDGASSQKFSSENAQRELEKKAKAETAYRKLLLERILDTRAGEDLQEGDLAAIASGFFACLQWDRRKQIAKAMGAIDDDTEAFQERIVGLPISVINRMLLTMALGSEVNVHWYGFDKNTGPMLHAAAIRHGIDAKAVKKQSEQPIFPPETEKKTKKKKGAA